MGTINFTRNGEMLEINIRDYSGAKIETLRCEAKDKKRYSKILNYLKDKYGFEPYISEEESVNNKEDIDWFGLTT